MEEKISISLQEYKELQATKEAYITLLQKLSAGGKTGGKKSSAKLTPEQRKERAKKAVEARIAKSGQRKRQ